MDTNKYQRGKIYQLIDNTNGNIYIGSTCEKTLARRLTKHVSNYKGWLKTGKKYAKSIEVLKNGDYKIVLIEEHPCETKDQLLRREQYFMEQMECINTCSAYRSPEARRIQQKEWADKNKNKDKVKQNNKEYIRIWRENNKEKCIEYGKEYNQRKQEHEKSFGGDPRYNNCCLLKIDLDLFD